VWGCRYTTPRFPILCFYLPTLLFSTQVLARASEIRVLRLL